MYLESQQNQSYNIKLLKNSRYHQHCWMLGPSDLELCAAAYQTMQMALIIQMRTKRGSV